MHPSVHTQRQSAAYARIQAAGEFLAHSLALPDETVNLAGIGHHDPNTRALLKLEAAANLVVRIAEGAGYAETAPAEFKPSEFTAGAETPLTAEPEPDEDLARPAGHGVSKTPAGKRAK